MIGEKAWAGAALWVAGVLLTGGLAFLGTGLEPRWPLVWLAPAPVLLYALEASWPRAGLAATAAWLLGGLNMAGYLAGLVPPVVLAMVLIVPAVAFAAAALLLRLASQRLPAWVAPFAFPAAWVAYEYLQSATSPHGTFGSLAYTQAECFPVLQVASFAGTSGIVFLVMLLPAAVAVAWSVRRDTRRSLVALLPAVTLVVGAFGFGMARLHRPPVAPAVPVGLAAIDGHPEAFRADDVAKGLPITGEYAESVRALAAAGARIVVLPEKLVGVTADSSTAVLEPIVTAAGEAGAAVVVGLNRVDSRPRHNLALVVGRSGEALASYEKLHVLPGWESGYSAGSGPAFFTLDGQTWGVAICKDMDFPATGRALARGGARLVVVPAWDFVRDARLHASMAVMRAVESGFAVARAARQGRLTLADDRGRLLADMPSDEGPNGRLVSALPPGGGATYYARHGDLFAFGDLALLAGLLAWLAWGRPASGRLGKGAVAK
jgi:apolipoprotein N-acyltransferase